MEQQHPLLGPHGRDWAGQQLDDAGYADSTVGSMVLSIIDDLRVFDYKGLGDDVNAALPLLAQLLLGKPLSDEHWSAKAWAAAQYVWRPAMPNSLSVGDPVRIKMDGYPDDDPMRAINGREGVIAGIRHGVLVAFMEDSYGPATSSMGVRIEVERLEQKLMVNRRRRAGDLMTGAVVLKFKVHTINEAVETATKLWRTLCENSEVELPPLTNMELTQIEDVEERFQVTVRMDIDRVQVEKTKSA